MKKTIRILYLLASCLFVLSISQCANIVAPVGGPKDETPPMLDSIGTTPNYQINYTKSPIILTFNEWIALKDAITQVVVSPPLQYPLEVKLKKKSVYVNFDEKEELKENTTYTINFGDAISDYTEGNVPPAMRYVFSTGPIIDSLQFRAKLIDLDTKKPIDDALLMLYVNRADSVLYKSRPYYFAKTDTSGVALIENIRADTFKVVALKDENLNYQLDGETELLSYLLDPVVVEGHTDLGALEMYTPQQPLNRRKVKSYYGKTMVQFNRAPYDLDYDLIGDVPDIDHVATAGDSLMLWYRDTTRGEWSFVNKSDTSQLDTFLIKKATHKKSKLGSQFDAKSRGRKLNFKSDTILTYRWSHPLLSIDPTQMTLAKDSLANPIDAVYVIDPSDPHLLKVKEVEWSPTAKYYWTISAGAVTDIFDTANDSIGRIDVVQQEDKLFGSIEVTFDSLEVDQSYFVQLQKGSQTARELTIPSGVNVVKFSLLEPAIYTVRLIEDDNKNGRWDTGDYDRQTIPERIFIKELAPLKANWEQTIDFKL